MTYLLDNAADQARDRMELLSELYDDPTRRNLAATGFGPGWSCLDIGAGGGSIARWLAEVAGPGRVTATDIDTRWLGEIPGVSVVQHDLNAEPVPPGPYDLIHARLVLMHLVNPDAVTERLLYSLRPGGWLVVEELDPMLPYVPNPMTEVDVLINEVGDAFTRALARRGADNTRGQRAHVIMRKLGLIEIHNEGTVIVATGGSPAARLMQTNATQTAGELTGLSTQDIERYVKALDDPNVTFYMPVFFAARGLLA